jgi:hypothetical protein
MLTIREAQMRSMEARLQADFVEQAVKTLASRFPARYQQLGEAAVREIATAGLAKGTRFGIGERADLECLIRWMFEHGPQFEAQPAWQWARAILEDPELPGDGKILLLRRRLEPAVG